MLSRAADSFYWTGRYVERAEHISRILRVHLGLLVGQADQSGDMRAWQSFCAALYLPTPVTEDGEFDVDAAFQMVHDLTFNAENRNSISSCINLARENARSVHSQLSTELWEQINRFYLRLNSLQEYRHWQDDRDNFYRDIENRTYLVQGLVQSSLLHDEGWFFIQLGMHLERILCVCSLLSAHFRYFSTESGGLSTTRDLLHWIGFLRACSSFEAYSRVYHPLLESRHIIEFLLLDPHLPRSLHFNINHLTHALQQVATLTGTRRADTLNRIAGRLQAHLAYSQVDEVLATGLQPYLSDVMETCNQIHDTLYEVYINYPIAEVFSQ